jgi:uncharacterized protein YpmB
VVQERAMGITRGSREVPGRKGIIVIIIIIILLLLLSPFSIFDNAESSAVHAKI